MVKALRSSKNITGSLFIYREIGKLNGTAFCPFFWYVLNFDVLGSLVENMLVDNINFFCSYAMTFSLSI